VHQGGGLQGMARALFAEHAAGNLAELVVEDREQALGVGCGLTSSFAPIENRVLSIAAGRRRRHRSVPRYSTTEIPDRTSETWSTERRCEHQGGERSSHGFRYLCKRTMSVASVFSAVSGFPPVTSCR